KPKNPLHSSPLANTRFEVQMRTSLPLPIMTAALLFLTACAISPKAAPPNYEFWSNYTNGAWFDVAIPPNFTAIPINKSSSSATGYDGARFVQQDGAVEFYVYSPQWSGLESDYLNEI